jgi:hypothetical protein
MSSADPLTRLLTDIDRPVDPRPEFARELGDRLLAGLASTAASSPQALRARIMRRPGTVRRTVVIGVALLLLTGIALAAYVSLRAWLDDTTRAPVTDPVAAARLAEQAPVRISLSGSPQGGNPSGGGGQFSLRFGSSTDGGPDAYSFWFGAPGTTAAGQHYATVHGTLTLTGRKGQLVLVTVGRAFGAVGDGAQDGSDVLLGTWTVLDGTGAYTGLRGSGAYAGIAGPGAAVALRLDGRLG